MPQAHIFHEFDHALAHFKSLVLNMACSTRKNFENAISSLLNRDLDLARLVIADDSEVDELEMTIDRLGMDILVRYHPVATDLRFVIASMKVIHNLERISDHAVNIAKRTKKLCKSSEFIETQQIEPIYELALTILNEAIQAYTDTNPEALEHLQQLDLNLDKLHKTFTNQLSSRLENAGPSAENFMNLLFISRSIERIGDLSLNIAEDTIFISDARDVRHHHLQK